MGKRGTRALTLNMDAQNNKFNKFLPKSKRSQVTIFIILAVLVIGALALFFVMKGSLKKNEIRQSETEPIKNFVDECIEEISEDVIYIVGQGGGYYFPPEHSTSSGATYYFMNGKNYALSKALIESEISENIKERIPVCTENFIDFSEYEIEQKEITVIAVVFDNEVALRINYPLIIKKGESTTKIQDFDTVLPARVGIAYDSARQISYSSSDAVCLSCILDISLKNDLYADVFDYDNETVIFKLIDNSTKLNEKPFEWVFANRY